MMMRTAFDGGSSGKAVAEAQEIGCEVRPGGMLVQKRRVDPDAPAAPEVRLRISYGAARYEVSVAARATFGELKKLLTSETGLQPDEQRLMYRRKVRENGDYLDVCGVKDRSKVVLVQDPTSLERRYVEMHRNAKIESAHRAISAISMEVDKLADQVITIEKSISSANKVTEAQIATLIELLMRQAVKLDSIRIPTDGDTSSQKSIQAKRVQKCVETLDVLKISNSKIKPVIVTTKWETFEAPTTMHWEVFE